MAVESTQPLTEMITMVSLWRWRWPAHRADNLTILMCWLSINSECINILEP
jgi:hypothetical protein